MPLLRPHCLLLLFAFITDVVRLFLKILIPEVHVRRV